ncbi:hypothetical protein AVEN_259303-1 [Araneus ventricosus]|uniref:Uncharacterized protein n=1 Tax=Araneus ventricosus TaxID=182803 RepID=A0A4Y2GKJ8_ARAVE|nr:hypothetical protein AVEN_259303-1 [Araneus ventricosus]
MQWAELEDPNFWKAYPGLKKKIEDAHGDPTYQKKWFKAKRVAGEKGHPKSSPKEQRAPAQRARFIGSNQLKKSALCTLAMPKALRAQSLVLRCKREIEHVMKIAAEGESDALYFDGEVAEYSDLKTDAEIDVENNPVHGE